MHPLVMDTDEELVRLRRQVQSLQTDLRFDREELVIRVLVAAASVGLILALALPFLTYDLQSISAWGIAGGAFEAEGKALYAIPTVLVVCSAIAVPLMATVEAAASWAAGTAAVLNGLAVIGWILVRAGVDNDVSNGQNLHVGGGMLTTIALLVVQVLAVSALRTRGIERARRQGLATRVRRRPSRGGG